MKASELIRRLRREIVNHGDCQVVWGLDSTGYGSRITGVTPRTVSDDLGTTSNVFDVEIADSASHCDSQRPSFLGA